MEKEFLSVSQAACLLRRCLEEGEVIPGAHFRQELANEGLTMADAWQVLRSGRIYDPPEQDIKTGEWKYRAEGPESVGKWIAIVFSFKSVNRAFLITIFSIATRSQRK